MTDPSLVMKKAFSELCSAMKQLEQSVASVADARLLGQCSSLREKAETIVLGSIHPHQR